jgi:hypothetical protein
MRFFQNILGFAAAFAAAGSLVSAAPLTPVASRELVARDYPHTLTGVVNVLVDLKANVAVIVEPLAAVDISADVVADVKVQLVAAVKAAVDVCTSIQADIGVLAALDVAAIVKIAVSLCAVIQVIVGALAKVTCGCVVAALADICAAIDAELVLLIKIVLSLCGGLAATLIVHVVALIQAVLSVDVFVGLKLTGIISILGL